MSLKLSLVELGAVNPGETSTQTVSKIIDTAQKIEEWGFHRIWLAEHHNTNSFVSRAPEVTIPFVASHTSKIRVGSGSVLLNHYSPFKVAEVFTLLEEMFPGRIDMGIGRATTGPVSDIALQRNKGHRQNYDDSMDQLEELINWLTGGFDGEHPFAEVKSHTGTDLPEFWLLGSSLWSAMAAAKHGLNYSFAGFINPMKAYNITMNYRANFNPSSTGLGGGKSRLILSLSVYCADTIEDAGKLAAPHVHMMQQLSKGNFSTSWVSEEEAVSNLGGFPESHMEDPKVFPRYLIGTPQTLEKELLAIASAFDVDEILIQCISSNHQNRLRCLKLLSETFELVS